jgi:hypothetical protein
LIKNLLNEKQISEVKTNICIIGAGAAGISIFQKLTNKKINCVICEGGNLEFEEKSQEIYNGKIIGDDYLSLEVSRLRYLGGSTNHWAGWCRPFEEIDYDNSYLDLGKHAKWPFEKKVLDFYLNDACKVLGIKNIFNTAQERERGRQNATERDVSSINFNRSDVRMGIKYYDELKNSFTSSLFLNSNLVEIEYENKIINSALFKSYNGNLLKVNAKTFIFAMGGIENSRFLLYFREKYNNFLNIDLPIGKYYMDHPSFYIGQMLTNKKDLNTSFFSINSKIQKKEKILNLAFWLSSNRDPKIKERLIKELKYIAPNLVKKNFTNILSGNSDVIAVNIWANSAQFPRQTNYIELSKNEKDKFGIPKVILNWKISDLEKKTYKKSINIFNNYVLENDLGRIKLEDWIIDQKFFSTPSSKIGNHHMGGTRMSDSEQYGVVDKNLKVFGLKNLYVASSSVFPTSGHQNPTLSIIQLSLRLADYLETEHKL